MRRGRPRRWLLVGSLALNLFLVGVVAAYQMRGAVPAAQPSARLNIDQIAETLPPADADRLETVFRSHAAELSEYTTAIRQSQDRERDLFRATPFDPKPVGDGARALQPRRRQARDPRGHPRGRHPDEPGRPRQARRMGQPPRRRRPPLIGVK
jgi:uncharacterized membrane protein